MNTPGYQLLFVPTKPLQGREMDPSGYWYPQRPASATSLATGERENHPFDWSSIRRCFPLCQKSLLFICLFLSNHIHLRRLLRVLHFSRNAELRTGNTLQLVAHDLGPARVKISRNLLCSLRWTKGEIVS
jgi:hypothetical protein